MKKFIHDFSQLVKHFLFRIFLEFWKKPESAGCRPDRTRPGMPAKAAVSPLKNAA
ncbi:hypothetical protein [uncultured Desulfovibrio sp.]|uniref:hypothetical protein n=1 Tax=uncultured Desulfovibrio sp. TaxID=167968 RepID=UPI0026233993|nr:hypothetical protein [uncultured Desulfovibrio sp.]